MIEGNADTLTYLRTVIWDEQQSVANRIKAVVARIPLPTPDAMTPEQRQIYESIVNGPRGTLVGATQETALERRSDCRPIR